MLVVLGALELSGKAAAARDIKRRPVEQNTSLSGRDHG
jgi:hypothetical protein